MATFLSTTDHIHLSYMQCAVLISAMDVEGDARIDYYDLLPVIVHGYRILASPQNVAQREVSARGPFHS